MSNALYRWGRSAARHPWRMLGAWLIVVLGVVALRSAVGGSPSDNFTSRAPRPSGASTCWTSASRPRAG